MATNYRESDLEWSDTHTVLTELKEKMEAERRQTQLLIAPRVYKNGLDTAITRCIALVEEKLKANSKEV